MPGIYGIAWQTAPAGLAATTADMAARLKECAGAQAHCHRYEQDSLALGRIVPGFENPAEQPAWNEDHTLAAVLHGEIYDYDAHRRRLTEAGHTFRGASHAELLVHGCEEAGKKFLEGLNGKFAAILWDARARRLTLVNDRFGMKPLYYVVLPGRLLVASEIRALLADPAVPRRMDLRGVAQFFTFGQLLGEDTMLEAIRLLPAAGWLTYDLATGQVRVERYWRLGGRKLAAAADRGAVLERVRLAFGRAVERCSAGSAPLGLSLSGGMDSRTILAALDPDRPVKLVSMGLARSIDHRLAAEMAHLTGRPHHQCELGNGFLERFEDHLKNMVSLTDGHYLSQCIVMPTLPVYRELGIGVLLRGHAGELMHMGKAYNFSLDPRVLAVHDEASLEGWLHRHLQTYMLDGTGGRLFAPAYRDTMAELARDSLRSCLAESAGVEPLAHRIWHLFISQRLRRETAMSMVKFGSVVETRLPYLDSDLVEALLELPPEMKIGVEVQTHILRHLRPDFLRIVNVNTGAPVEAGPLRRWFGKARQKVLAKLGVGHYQPYERLGLWLRRELRPLVKRLLLNEPFLERGIFEPDSVRDVVAKHLSGHRNHTFLIMAMMIFEMGQRHLIDPANGEPAATPTGDRDASLIRAS